MVKKRATVKNFNSDFELINKIQPKEYAGYNQSGFFPTKLVNIAPRRDKYAALISLLLVGESSFYFSWSRTIYVTVKTGKMELRQLEFVHLNFGKSNLW